MKKFDVKRPIVCIQGLGFVGAVTALVIADARDSNNMPLYNVFGVDLPNVQKRVDMLNEGRFPFENMDSKINDTIQRVHKQGNFIATVDESSYAQADVILMDINMDLIGNALDLDQLRRAATTIGSYIHPGVLVIVETTVPPGSCRQIIQPVLSAELEKRGFSGDEVFISHSYERVMPGKQYWDSIVNYPRVFAGLTKKSAHMCRKFLESILNVSEYPLTQLETVEASELAKLLENSYRAVNIAFIDEWSRFAEQIGVDLFSVINAIRKRPTHANLMWPGFGVGGYCLTKDPLFATLAARDIFQLKDLSFPFSTMSVEINNNMPIVSLNIITELLNGLSGKKILLLGVSYRQDVGDTRRSPSEIFVREAQRQGAVVLYHDPFVAYWHELEVAIPGHLPEPDVDCVVFAVQHQIYRELDIPVWLKEHRPLLFDANNVLTESQREDIHKHGITIRSIGRG